MSLCWSFVVEIITQNTVGQLNLHDWQIKESADVIKHKPTNKRFKMSSIKALAEIQQRANKLGCLLLKSDFCFNVVPSLIQFVANWQRFSTSHLSSILASSPRVYLSSRHDASFPLCAIADTEAQTNKCAHMDPHMVYVHSRAYRASLFAERVLLTTKDTHTRLLNSSTSTCKGRS